MSGELQTYLKEYVKDQSEQESNSRNQLEKHYKPAKAQELAREFMMYDS